MIRLGVAVEEVEERLQLTLRLGQRRGRSVGAQLVLLGRRRSEAVRPAEIPRGRREVVGTLHVGLEQVRRSYRLGLKLRIE